MKKTETLHLFPLLTEELLNLLRNISESDWLKPSPINGRTVKDLVSHIIDGSLRKLSIQRDDFSDNTNVPDIRSYSDLVGYIQKLNSDWMNVTRRLSPEIMIDLLEYSENQFNKFILTLNPDDIAIFPVNWAGENESKNWFDIAREYTEVWHHQMQIRMALNKPLLMEPKFTKPLYDTFMRGLPYLFRDLLDYNTGYLIKVTVFGKLNSSWFIEKNTKGWGLTDKEPDEFDTSVKIPDDIAWIIFTNTDRDKEKFKSKIKIDGDKKIGLKLGVCNCHELIVKTS